MFGASIRYHRVQPGETLEKISEAYYGKPDYHSVIAYHNQFILPNPNQLTPGQQLAIPYIRGAVGSEV